LKPLVKKGKGDDFFPDGKGEYHSGLAKTRGGRGGRKEYYCSQASGALKRRGKGEEGKKRRIAFITVLFEREGREEMK